MSSAKDLGNIEFKLGNWIEAIKFYSKAIKSLPDAPETAALYSNRSAAYVKRSEFDRALLDAESCIRLKPEWSKGHVREAEAYGYLRHFKPSAISYSKAISLAENGETKTRYLEAARRVEAIGKRSYSDTMRIREANDGPGGNDKVSDLLEGGHIEKNLTKFSAAQQFKFAVDCANAGVTAAIGAAESDFMDLQHNSLDYVELVSDALIYDHRTSRYPSAPMALRIEKAKNYLASPRMYNYSQFKDPSSSVITVIAHFDNIIKTTHDWSNSRLALTCLIRISLIEGYLTETATKELRKERIQLLLYAVNLIKRGRIVWEKFGEDTTGFVFSNTFLHGVIALVTKVTLQGYRAGLNSLDFSARTIRIYANYLVEDPNPIDPSDTIPFNLAFISLPKATGYEALALLEVDEAARNMTKIDGLSYGPKKSLEKVSKYSKLSASNIPEDSIDHSYALFVALFVELQIGGKSLNYIFDTCAIAERSWQLYDKWAGPITVTDKNGNVRTECIAQTLIQDTCEAIRNWLVRMGSCNCYLKESRELHLRYTLNRIPNNPITDLTSFMVRSKSDAPIKTIEEGFANLNLGNEGGKIPCPMHSI